MSSINETHSPRLGTMLVRISMGLSCFASTLLMDIRCYKGERWISARVIILRRTKYATPPKGILDPTPPSIDRYRKPWYSSSCASFENCNDKLKNQTIPTQGVILAYKVVQVVILMSSCAKCQPLQFLRATGNRELGGDLVFRVVKTEQTDIWVLHKILNQNIELGTASIPSRELWDILKLVTKLRIFLLFWKVRVVKFSFV